MVKGKVMIRGKFKFGILYVIAVLTTVPVNSAGPLFRQPQPRDLPGDWASPHYTRCPALALVATFG